MDEDTEEKKACKKCAYDKKTCFLKKHKHSRKYRIH